MSSSVVAQEMQYIQPPSIAIVEQIPNIPDKKFWVNQLRQKDKTRFYWQYNFGGDATSTVLDIDITAGKYDSVEESVAGYLDKAYFVEGSVAQLISENIDDLF
jgi:hypothetical protein